MPPPPVQRAPAPPAADPAIPDWSLPPPPAVQGPTAGFRPLRGLLPSILVLLVVNVLANAASVLIPVDPDGPIVATDIVSSVGFGIWLLTSIALAVLVLVFLYRARRNLDALGIGGLRWSPGWTIGSWFIPFGNLVLPVLVVAEVWRASGARGPWSGAPAGPVRAWWAFFLISRVLGEVWGVIPLGAAAEFPIGAAHVLADAAAAFLFAVVLRGIEGRQASSAGSRSAWPSTRYPVS